MTWADLPTVDRIGAIVHPRFPERAEVPAERLALFPAGCLVATAGPRRLGYAIAHPSIVGAPPPLDTLLGELPQRPDCLYLHDVALLPEVRGSGLGAALVHRLVALARRLRLANLALTAVGGSAPYWRGHGFGDVEPAVPGLAAKLSSYGSGAAYLVRPA